MKKIVSLLLAFILLTGCCSALAANDAQYETTKSILSTLDDAGIKYTWKGTAKDAEHIIVGNKDEVCTIEIDIFAEESLFVYFRVFNVIYFAAADLNNVLRLCSTLNDTYNFLKFYVDEDDYSVTVTYDLITWDEDCGMDVLLAMVKIVQIIDDAYPSLAVYAK